MKLIKALDRYSELVQAIKWQDKLKSPEDMLALIQRSIKISNQQGYTNILSAGDIQDRRYDQRRQYNQQQSYNGKR